MQIEECDKYAARALEKDPHLMFVIQRNHNKNAVGYSFINNNVQARWFEFEADRSGSTRSAVTELERLAFGVTQKGVTFRMKAIPGHVLHVGQSAAGKPVAVMTHEGVQIVLRRVWVQLKIIMWVQTPVAEFIDIFGTNIATGEPVRVRI